MAGRDPPYLRRIGRLPVDQEISPPRARRRLSYALTDLAVITACSFAFLVVVVGAKSPPDRGPPLGLIARDLGTTPEHFKQVADKVLPRPPIGTPHRPPTEAQKLQVAIALDVSVERLDRVIAKYRPARLRLP